MFEDSSSIPSIWASMNSWFTPAVLFVILNVMIGTIAFTSSTFSHQKHPHKPQNDDAAQPPRLTRSPSVLQRLRSFNFQTTYASQEPLLNHNRIRDSHNNHFAPQHKTRDSDAHFPPQQNIELEEEETQKFFQQTQFNHIPDSQTHFVVPDPNPHFQQTHKFFQLTHLDPTDDDSESHYYAPTEGRRQGNDSAGEGEDTPPSIDEVYRKLRERHVNRTNSDTKPSGGEMPERLPAKIRKSASVKSAFSHFEEENDDVVEARRPATVREGSSSRTAEADEEVDSKADDFINKFKQQLKLQRLDSIIRYKDMISRGGGGGK